MEKGKRLKIRIFSILLVACVIVGCVLPAFGASYLQTDRGYNAYAPRTGGTVQIEYADGTNFMWSIPEITSTLTMGYTQASNVNNTPTYSNINYESFLGGNITFQGTHERLGYLLWPDPNKTVFGYHVFLDDFTILGTYEWLSYWFVFSGAGRFHVSFDVTAVTPSGEIKTIPVNSTGTIGDENGVIGRKTPVTLASAQNIAEIFGYQLNRNEYYLIQNFRLDYNPYPEFVQSSNHNFRFEMHCKSVPVVRMIELVDWSGPEIFIENALDGNYVTDSPSSGGGTVTPPPIETNDWFTALISPVITLFDTPIFGTISLGDIFGIIVGLCVVFWVLKFFAGG